MRPGERRPATLPGLVVLLLLSLAILPGAFPSWGQPASGGPSGTPSGGDSSAPAQPSGTSQPSTTQPTTSPTAPAGTTAAPVFVPPAPPGPSQSHLPGPFSFGQPGVVPTAVFELHPSLTLSESYTDNFHLSQGRRTENLRSTLGPGFTLLINTPNTQGSITTSLNVSHDTSRDGFNAQFFPTFSGSLRHTFSPVLSFTLTDSFARDDEPSQGDQFGLRAERRTFIRNSFSAAVDWQIGQFNTQYFYRNTLFLSDTDTTSHIFGGNASIRILTLNTLRVGYELSLSDISGTDRSGVTNSSSDSNGASVGHHLFASLSRQIGTYGTGGVSTSYSTQSRNESRIWNIQVFGAYGLPTGLSVSGSLGYSLLSSRNQDNDSAVTTNTTVSYRLNQLLLSLGVSQDFRQTFTEGQDFGIVLTRSFTGRASYQWTPFISSSVFATYSENEFTGSGNSSQAGRSFNTLSYGANMGWQILRWLSMGIDVLHIERSGDADLQGSGTTENRGTLRLTASF